MVVFFFIFADRVLKFWKEQGAWSFVLDSFDFCSKLLINTVIVDLFIMEFGLSRL